MPSERFLKLSQEKQQKILCAAMHEFCAKPMESVSINQIVREAGISRGSFYTYFEDKEDVLIYIRNSVQKKHDDVLKDCLLQEKGDLFAALERFFEASLRFLQETKLYKIHKDVALHANVSFLDALNRSRSGCGAVRERELSEWVFAHADLGKLRIETAGEMHSLLLMCYANIIFTVMAICVNQEHRETLIREYRTRTEIIKGGAVKHG